MVTMILTAILTDSSWLMVTSSTLLLNSGFHGASITVTKGLPMVGEGSTKSIFGGGTLKVDNNQSQNLRKVRSYSLHT